jgi:1-aminocyclopropane-1-carboxylate deaminase/D-cysteine desulfhydrase-like pyridoxal-dependent ACC family enzyme
MENVLRLINTLQSIEQNSYSNESRIHPLNSFNFSDCQCFVKREDELGFGISGSKIRKYRSLIPFLIKNQIREVIVIGSAYSNHVLSISQLLIENKINVTLFLRGDPTRTLQGNGLLISLLVPSSSIKWFSKEAWKNVYEEAKYYAKNKKDMHILPEGAAGFESFPGALTLSLDIIRNEKENCLAFNHIFIDSGTGLTAIALILAYHFLQKKTLIHVILMAENESYFLKQLSTFHLLFQQLLSVSDFSIPSNFQLHLPYQGKKFGQLHPDSFKNIVQFAQCEGIWTDPIYTEKLFHTSKDIIKSSALRGSILIIHSGGALSLMGFENQLKALIT